MSLYIHDDSSPDEKLGTLVAHRLGRSAVIKHVIRVSMHNFPARVPVKLFNVNPKP